MRRRAFPGSLEFDRTDKDSTGPNFKYLVLAMVSPITFVRELEIPPNKLWNWRVLVNEHFERRGNPLTIMDFRQNRMNKEQLSSNSN